MLRFVIAKLFFVLFIFQLKAQEIPPIERFSPQDYSADDQNWSISQAEDENIYIANNRGLLEYNGARWNLYSTPNQSIVRSVAVIKNRIYTGSYMDFGFWERNNFGTLVYTSIAKEVKDGLVEDEEFWNIIPYNKYVLFQSLDRIYIYDSTNNTFGIIKSETRITKAFRVENTIYFHETGIGVSKIENGKARLVLNNVTINNNEIVNIFQKEGNLLLLTRENGFYKFDGLNYSKWEISSNNLLSEISVYNSIRLRNGNFILGTISNGLIKLDAKGNLLFQINRNQGLSNNTVLSAYQDKSGNVWLGLDNGINVLNLNSPYRLYTDNQGYLGTVYASAKTSEYLYLGTNQGLFYRPLDSKEKFTLISNTKGQVWFLKTIGGNLFCGHDKGSFEVVKDKAIKISDDNGVWNIKTIQDHPDLLIEGNYNGLSIIEKSINGKWRLRNKIRGFDISSRYFEFVSNDEILVSHEYKGVYKLKLSENFYSVISYDKINDDKGIGSSLVDYNGEILYAFQDGVFSYNSSSDSFSKSTLLQSYFSEDNYVSGKLISDKDNARLIGFFKNEIVFVEPGVLADEPTIKVIDLPSDLRGSKLGYENIIHLENKTYLLGTTDGYLIIDTNKSNAKDYNVTINGASYSTLKKDVKPIDIKSQVTLNNKEHNLYFNYSVTDFEKLSTSIYQYRLLGLYDSWSNWSPQPKVFFENLPYGDYTFQVRAKVGSKISSNIASYNFSIEKPWYLKTGAIICYVLIFLFTTALIQYFNRIHYKKQKQKLLLAKEKEFEIKELENERQIMEFKNKTLQQDIESKNRELGISTMNLIRKNEFLSTVKNELGKANDLKDLNKVVKIIDKNINNTEDWKFFEEAFNNADKDFLKKIKKQHPALTPNDLKLCAYLRLNLSSKEIAPLLNISHRSVEVKRYRLRKKMNLPHEASLTNHILEI
ncbi:helix-turn-helix and ligand-binding sensor domain-containing protein [Winogradskyella jejuensis]|uniref:Two component regulator propeller n=1 Tax=Winogradskyella jejuensis TaxID=1089305 RepID=A0A1M5LMC8_9FLAO|nr:triple tyrosine motif-containing protein [Winogradskyella jejuensis]SHG66208.1 Two component regulator propeller [Winogradskyella jejuensis]